MEMGLGTVVVEAQKRLGPLRMLGLQILIFAFLLQGLVVGAHFHASWGEDGLAAEADADGPAPHDDGGTPCPICQTVAFAGTFIAGASAIALLQRTFIRAVIGPDLAASGPLRTSHDWFSRGPPLSV